MFEDWRVGAESGAVDGNVQAAEAFDGKLHHAGDLLLVANIAADRGHALPERSPRPLQGLGVLVGEDDLGTLGDEALGDRQANARRPPR